MSKLFPPRKSVGNPIFTYLVRTGLFMTVYVILNMAAILGAFEQVALPGAYVLGVAVGLPVAGHMWAALDYIDKADEYIGGVMAKRFILSAGAAIAVFSGWGFLESYAQAPHAPGWLVYPLFWFLFGMTSLFDYRHQN